MTMIRTRLPPLYSQLYYNRSNTPITTANIEARGIRRNFATMFKTPKYDNMKTEDVYISERLEEEEQKRQRQQEQDQSTAEWTDYDPNILRPHVERESSPTLDPAKKAFILNELWKQNINMSDRDQVNRLVFETVRRTFPGEHEDQAREIEKKIHRILEEKRNVHRRRED